MAGVGLATNPIDDAEVAEVVRDLTDYFRAGGRVRANKVQMQDGHKNIKLAVAQEFLNALGDGGRVLMVTGFAIFFQRQRQGKHGVKGRLVVQKV